MDAHRSTIPCSYALVALLVLAAFALTRTWADLPDPCGGSSTVPITHVGDMAILQADSDSSLHRRAAVADERLLWPNGTVYFTIDPAFSGELNRAELDVDLIIMQHKHKSNAANFPRSTRALYPLDH